MGGDRCSSFAWLRHLRAANSRHHARQCARADRRLDQPAGRWHPLGWRADILSRRIICWLSQAPFVLQDADARFYRRFIRSLSRQVRYLRRTLNARARRPAAAAGADRAQLRGAVHAGPVRAICAPMRARLVEELRRADPARRRPYQPQSRRADRAAGRPAAAAAIVLGAQPAAAAGDQQRHRPHDADAALFPAWRRQFRAVQRHGADAGRSARHRARL